MCFLHLHELTHTHTLFEFIRLTTLHDAIKKAMLTVSLNNADVILFLLFMGSRESVAGYASMY